jgi:hypothetical protein
MEKQYNSTDILLRKLSIFLRYATIVLLFLVAFKWIVLLLVDHNMVPVVNATKKETVTKHITPHPKVEVDFSLLKPKAEQMLSILEKDLQEQQSKLLDDMKRRMLQNLDREEGFLDWLYGWGTGWKMVMHAAWGLTDEKESAEAFVEEHFRQMVIMRADPEFFTGRMVSFAKERTKDFFLSLDHMVKKSILRVI